MLKRRLEELFTPNVISVSPRTPVCQAIQTMRSKDISCIVVLEENKPIGIFTERNVVSFTAQRAVDFDDCEIRELMSSPVLTANKNVDIYTAYNLIETNKVRHLVVVDEKDRAVGVVTLSNMVEHLGYEYFIEIKRVSQVMTRVLFSISKDTTVHQTVTEMARKSLSCVIIVENDRPVGIFTERDMVKLVVDHRDIRELKIEEVMSSPVQTVSRDTLVHEVPEIMKQKDIRRVVVVDKDGKIVGLTTQTDLVRGLEAKYVETLKELIKEKDVKIKSTSRDLADKTVHLDNILRSSIHMGIVATDLNLRISYFNPGAEEILGYSAEEVIGRNAREIHSGENAGLPRFDTMVETIPKNKSHSLTFEQNKNNDRRFIHARVSGIWNSEEKLVGFVLMLLDITERRRAQEALQKAHDELEQRVEERTAELALANKDLQQEIRDRKQAEEALKEREAELEARTTSLEEVNTALRVLLKRLNEDKKEIEDKVSFNVEELVIPYLERLKGSKLNDRQRAYVDSLELNLRNVVSPFVNAQSAGHLKLAPREVQIVDLIRQSKSTKEIAGLLCLSTRTIESYRDSIRKKMGIKNKKVSLRTYLSSLQ